MNNAKLLISTVLAFLLFTELSNAATSTTVDEAGFLKNSTGKKWKRINVSSMATDTKFAFFNIRLECNPETQSVFVDDIGIVTIPKSAEQPDSDISSLATFSQFVSPVDDWEIWIGATKIKTSVDGLSKDISLPVHQIELLDQKKGGNPTFVTSIRLNPAPSRPREVLAYNGNANGLASKIQSIAMGAFGGTATDFPAQFNTLIVSQSGLTYGISFDLANLKADLAQAIHKHCGNP